ncbi:MAG: hypothetical protein KAJ14_10490 [Candidatus Omnitrophica bacterium]|nr:hypothetical protein [Candidatus Omnitrophota bacterium]
MLDIKQIQDLISQRYPYLMVDRIVDIDEGKIVVGLKNITVNEPFFQGYFTDSPILPGMVIIEAMAQGTTFLFHTNNNRLQKLNFFKSSKRRAFFLTGLSGGPADNCR